MADDHDPKGKIKPQGTHITYNIEVMVNVSFL